MQRIGHRFDEAGGVKERHFDFTATRVQDSSISASDAGSQSATHQAGGPLHASKRKRSTGGETVPSKMAQCRTQA